MLRYSREIVELLVNQGVKAIVIACNTATAHALPAIREEIGIPVLGVIEPGARAATGVTRTKRIGVIGTFGTIKSGAYEKEIRKIVPDAFVFSQACPLFVPLAEEGWTEDEATRIIAERYLTPVAEAKTDTLVLGCTHYPLLKGAIGRAVGREVRLIDSAEETARETAEILRERKLEAEATSLARYRFIASDAPEQFLRVGQRFLGSPIDRVETITLG